jgi:hypothetical protein
MIVDYDGMKIRIPKGYAQTEDGTFVNGHGVEYALVTYGRGDCVTVCLETIYAKHVRTVEVEAV